MALEVAARAFGRISVGHPGGAAASGDRCGDRVLLIPIEMTVVVRVWTDRLVNRWLREEPGVMVHEMRHLDANRRALRPLAPRQLHLFNTQINRACRTDGKVCGRG